MRMETKIKGYIRNAAEVFKIKFANRESADIAKFVKAYVMANFRFFSLYQNIEMI